MSRRWHTGFSRTANWANPASGVSAAYEPDLAHSLNNLSIRLGAVNRNEEGLAAIEEAVEMRRRLATANPAAYEAHLTESPRTKSALLA